jgi:CrcB protein
VTRLALVAVGGAAGAVARYLIGGWAAARWSAGFPFGTLLVNVTGSFLLGLLATLTTERFVSPNVRVLLGIGFLGAYTTFSTFAYESLQLLAAGSFGRAALNMVGSLLVGLAAVWLGVVVARLL